MIDLFFTNSNEVIKKANKYFESMFYDIDFDENDISMLNHYFPEHLILVETEKCKKIFMELYCWIKDSFIHNRLSILHKYCLYQFLSDEAIVQQDLDEEEIVENDDIDELFLQNINKAKLYLEFYFEDLDFLEYENFYNIYNTILFYSIGYSYEIKELLPRDLRDEIDERENIYKDKLRKKDYKNEEGFLYAVENLFEFVKRKIEENSAFKLLWNNDGNKNEKSAQILFRTIIDSYCSFYDIDLSCEVDTGRGCVDFKLSNGNYKVLIEIKNETKYVSKGINSQLRTYLNAENIKHGYLVVFIYSDAELIKVKNIKEAEFNKSKKEILRLIEIDVRYDKKTASKL